MGFGAIAAFGSISGNVSSDEIQDRLHHGTDATGHGGPYSARARGPDSHVEGIHTPITRPSIPKWPVGSYALL